MSWSINADNGGGGDPAVWARARQLWEQAGIAHFPWLHVHSLADARRLIEVGEQFSSPAIGLNVEDVVGDGIDLRDLRNLLLSRWNGPVHMPTLPWVQNGQGWQHLGGLVVAALEIFPDENETSRQPVQVLIDHAFAEGLTKVTLMFKTKEPNAPDQYDLSLCHGLYTGDDIPPLLEEWRRWRAPSPCVRPQPSSPSRPMPEDEWYKEPYPKGAAVGPAKLPRVLHPPSAGKGTFRGPAARAAKRAISRAQRWKPWNPSNWDGVYWELFAMGKGTGDVGDSGVRGFQRQEGLPENGVLDDATYQRMRRARVPAGPNKGKPIFDAEALRLLTLEAGQYGLDAKLQKIRDAVSDFCLRAEANEEDWHYTQKRPYTGLGVEPEKAHENDCSGYVILAFHWAQKVSGLDVPDPSGYEYEGWGNTWDDLDGHPKIGDGDYFVGDLAHYDGHVTLCRRPGDAQSSVWSSFGSESGPEPFALYYRGDLRFVVRPPLLV